MRGQHVDLWWSDLRAMDLGLLQQLDPVEASRAQSIGRTADLGRFVVGATLLRVAVAAAAGLDPHAVTVDRTCDECSGPHGRPRVRDGHVSVAHAGPLVLVATSPVPVGVDVESTRRGPDVEAWVREEATFKATGSRIGPGCRVTGLPARPGHVAAVAIVDGQRGIAAPALVVHGPEESARALSAHAAGPGWGSPRLGQALVSAR